MPYIKRGNKCLVDTLQMYYDDAGKPYLFVEMDGLSWDSREYDTNEEFLQSIIDHAYNVTMGKE